MCVCVGNDEATITIADEGYSPSMRHLAQAQGADIGFLRRCFHTQPLRTQLKLTYRPSEEMAADILTKHIDEAAKWKHAQSCLRYKS
jgi:hypothetical protein